jgi:hypothetical protein
VSLPAEPRVQVLRLDRVEEVSLVLLAVRTWLSRHAMPRARPTTRRQEPPAEGKTPARCPCSQGRVERRMAFVRADLLRRGAP